MHLTAGKLRKLGQCPAALVIRNAQQRKRHQHLIGMQPRIMSVKISNLRLLDRLDHITRQKLYIMVNAGQMLDSVQYQCGT